jgi:RimJ/RimL family protein N-acetyltransferase/broad-specificity NMP kinase
MRVLVLGNSGAGKSTLARALAAAHDLVHLDLDTLVWAPHQIAVARPTDQVLADLDAFVAQHPRWVIEGSYGDLCAHLAPHATALRWLDVGVETCVQHHKERPWEPHKYDDPADQERNRLMLETWVRSYDTRDDRYGRAWHARVYADFSGPKSRLQSWQERSPTLHTARLDLRVISLATCWAIIHRDVPLATRLMGAALGEWPSERERTLAFPGHLRTLADDPSAAGWRGRALVSRALGCVVGSVNLKGPPVEGDVEVGYGTLPAYRGQGFAQEGVAAVAAWALTQPGVTGVTALIHPDNPASARVAAGAGFTRTTRHSAEHPDLQVWRREAIHP